MNSMFQPRIVFFSSATENTRRFVDKLELPSERIPMRTKNEFLNVDYPYILVIPTYKGGANTGAVPLQVIKFLNDETNRGGCVGVVVGGNINFGGDYTIAGDVVSQKLNVPVLHRFELMGLPEDVRIVREGIDEHWHTLLNMKGFSS